MTITRGVVPALVSALLAACSARPEVNGTVPEDELWVDPARLERGEALQVEAREQPIPLEVVAGGRVSFDDLRVQHVFSPVAGQVTRVVARPGDRVRKGSALLAVLSPDVGTAVSDVVKAEADLAQTAADLARQERLVAFQAAPRRDLDAAQDSHRRAQAELARARQKSALLRSGAVDAVTQEYTLTSAIDGEVLARNVGPGMQVQGAYSGGAPAELFTVGDIERVWVLADVPESDLARVREGAPAAVRVAAWPGRVFRGTVDWVAGVLDPAVRTARVRIALSNGDRALKPEMLAQVSIDAGETRALAIPAEALVRVEGQTFAYAADGAAPGGHLRFKRRRVRLAGEPSGSTVAIESGLSRGERVLLERASVPAAVERRVVVTHGQVEGAGLRVEAVSAGDVDHTLTASGRVAFDEARVAHVFSPVTGRIVRALVQPGQRVARGAPLLAVVSPEVGTAFSDSLKANADLVAAEHELARQRDLFDAHAASRRDLEAAESSWRKASAEAERARQKTALFSSGTFDAVTQEYTLRSPIAGEVVARMATPGLEVQGQWSGAGSPAELFTIGSLDPLWVIGDVYEMDLPHVQNGLSVEVRVPAFPDHTFRGRIEWVSDVLDPATRTAKIRCAIDNPGHLLRPEMAPVLSIALPGHPRVGVPRDALLRLGEDTIVFVAAEDARAGELAFTRRKVIAGEAGRQGVVPVLDGLAAGERVVVSGGIFLAGLL